MSYTKHLIAGGLCAMAMAGVSQAAATNDVTGVTVGSAVYRITTNTTWTSANEWRLMGIILVGNGVTLTIGPGTIIRGANETTTGVNNRPGTLIVERGGKLYANGTAQHPIIFTDEWDDHNPWATGVSGTVKTRTWRYRNGSGTAVDKTSQSYDYGKLGDHHGCWGGVVLCGKALVTWDSWSGPLGTAEIAVEGVDTGLGVKGGGNDDNDSSGEMSYVQIRYGGYALTGSKEINGFTMFGVGRGTKLHHIEVYNNIDDCYEWFGGCVDGKYFVAWGTGDDMFDSDCGYRGVNQFFLGVQRDMGGSKIESGAPDKGMEIDGFETTTPGGSFLFSNSLWANITLIGADFNKDVRNVGLSMRDNVAPQLYNSIIMDFGMLGTLIENRTDITANGVTLNASDRFTTDVTNIASYGSVQFGVSLADGTSTLASLYPNSVSGKQACIRGCEFWNVKAIADTTVASGMTALTTKYPWITTAVGAGPGVSTGLKPYAGFTISSEGNVTDMALSTDGGSWTANTSNLMPILKRYRKQISSTSPVTGLAYPVNSGTAKGWFAMEIDPRPANDATYGALVVPSPKVTPTSFRGAFEPTKNWAKGWTTIGTLTSTNSSGQAINGVFGATSMVNALAIEGDVTNTLQTVVTNTVTTTVGVNGIVYASNGAPVTGTAVTNLASICISPVVTYTITDLGTYQLQTTASLSSPTWTVLKTFTVSTVPVTVNLTDITGATPPNAGNSAFFKLIKQ